MVVRATLVSASKMPENESPIQPQMVVGVLGIGVATPVTSSEAQEWSLSQLPRRETQPRPGQREAE